MDVGGGAPQFSVEFVVPGQSVGLLKKNVPRIKELFNIEVKFSSTFERGKTTMQWVKFDGGQSSAKEMESAKSYIVSMTNPTVIVNLNNFPLDLYRMSVDEVETESCAFVSRIGNDVVLQGSQLAVVLAQSMLESVQQDTTTETDPSKQNGSMENMLEDDVVDGRLAIDSQSIPNQSTALSPTRSPRRPCTENSPHVLELKNSHSARRGDPSSQPSPFHGTFSPAHSPKHSKENCRSPPSRVLCGGADDNESASAASPSDDGIAMQFKCLHDLGLAHSYDVDVIEEGLKRCDMTDIVKPTEFLNILKFISKAKRSSPTLWSSDSSSASNTKNLPSSRSLESSIKSPDVDLAASTSATASLARVHTGSPSSSSPSRQGSVIFIDSDSEDNRKEEVEALVISSDEDDSPFRIKKSKKKAKPAASKVTKQKPAVKSVPAVKRPLPVPLLNRHNTAPPQPAKEVKTAKLRHIVLDGNNVAMFHGNHKVYSAKGIEICMNYFLERGHKVTAFVSGSRRYWNPRKTFPLKDKHILERLESEGNLKFTPSRRLADGRIIAGYDDRFILNLADAEQGIVVSNDQYRDLLYEKPSYKDLIENRLLPFMFVGDLFMPPDDPLGRDGPNLDQFLRFEETSGSRGGATAMVESAPAVPTSQRQPFSIPGQGQPSPPAKKRKVLASHNRRSGDHTGGSPATPVPITTTRTDKLKLKGKPIRQLRQIHPDVEFKFVRRTGSALARMYTMSVTVEDETFAGTGPTKQAARQVAAKDALEHVLDNGTAKVSVSKSLTDPLKKKRQALKEKEKLLKEKEKALKEKEKALMQDYSESSPINDLRLRCPDHQFSYVSSRVISKKGSRSRVYTAAVTVNKERFEGCGSSHEEAKQMAARTALERIFDSSTDKAEKQSNDGTLIVKLRKLFPHSEFFNFDRSGPLHAIVHSTEIQINGEIFQGSGPSKKAAKIAAAEAALRKFSRLAEYDTRSTRNS